MQINARYIRKSVNEEGKTEITLELNGLLDEEQIRLLDKGETYRIKLTPIRSKRSLEQNALLWALIDEMSEARGDDTSDGKWEVYLELLEEAQASYYYIQADVKAADRVRRDFRTVREVNRFVNEKGNTIVAYQCFDGSSKLDKVQMSKLLEVAINKAAEYDIYPIYE